MTQLAKLTASLWAASSRLAYGVIAWRLGFGLMTLLVLSGMVEIWEKGSGSDSSAVAALADVMDHLFSAVLIAFVVSFCAWGVSRRRSLRGQSDESGNTPRGLGR
jgi:hypothetical protein